MFFKGILEETSRYTLQHPDRSEKLLKCLPKAKLNNHILTNWMMHLLNGFTPCIVFDDDQLLCWKWNKCFAVYCVVPVHHSPTTTFTTYNGL